MFEGFLPRKGSARTESLAAIAACHHTTVLFEAPSRVAATLADLVGACGPDRAVAVARELTKVYEEVFRGTLAEAHARAEETDARGEHVVIVGPAPIAVVTDDEIADAAAAALVRGMSARDAADDIAARLGVPRRRAYEAVLTERRPRVE
jgi:16S rRNA (cytidine1402-2'-O)-methyltransferase